MRSSKTIGPASTRKRQTGSRPSVQRLPLLILRELPALPQVARHQPPRDQRGPLGLQLRFGAVAGIDLPLGNQTLKAVAVEIEAVGLVVGAVRTAHPRPLIPVDPQPLQLVEEILFEGLGRPGPVGIFDAQHKDAAVMPREKPVEERRPRVADVEFPCRRGGESHPDLWSGHDTYLLRERNDGKGGRTLPGPHEPHPLIGLGLYAHLRGEESQGLRRYFPPSLRDRGPVSVSPERASSPR